MLSKRHFSYSRESLTKQVCQCLAYRVVFIQGELRQGSQGSWSWQKTEKRQIQSMSHCPGEQTREGALGGEQRG